VASIPVYLIGTHQEEIVNYQKLLQTAIEAALAAGEKILEVYGSEDFDLTLKDDDSPLTRADVISQQTITDILATGSDFPLLGEEGREIPFAERSEWETFWLVDPLDGTKEFVKRNGEFTVNIALIAEGRPVLGVLYVPVKDVLYYGFFGGGAFRVDGATGMALASVTTAATKLPDTIGRVVPPVRVVASRSHFSAETAAFVEDIESKHGTVDLLNAGSALKIYLVAEGRADIYPRLAPTMEWDVGAGQIIAEEAGCTVVQAESGKPLLYNKENLVNPHFIVTRPFVATSDQSM
jgi:3'(2'), 5'-bisphosphate nucleotidase